jgi:hypothetical protein
LTLSVLSFLLVPAFAVAATDGDPQDPHQVETLVLQTRPPAGHMGRTWNMRMTGGH